MGTILMGFNDDIGFLDSRK